MEVGGWRGFKYNGNKKHVGNEQRPSGYEEECFGSQGGQ